MSLVVVAALCLAGALALFLAYPAQAQGDGELPARPTGLAASAAAGGGVDLAWDDPEDDSITGYEVLRRDRAIHDVGVFVTIEADTGSKETAYTDAMAQAGGSYVYRVKAINAHGRSEWSSYDRIDLPAEADDPEPTPTPTPTPGPEATPESLAPANLTAGIVDDGVALGWDAPAEDADSVTGYEILRAQGEAELTTLVADTESTATSYTDTTATEPGETYAYRVKAIRDEEKSQGSNQAEVLIPHTPEDLAPANLTAEIVDDGVALIWDAPDQDDESVTGYEVSSEWTAAGGDMPHALKALIDSVATAWTDRTDKEAGVRYTYRVRAVRDGERSGWSNAAHVDLPGKESRNPKDEPPVALPQVVNESELWSTTMTVGYFSDGAARGYVGSQFQISYGSLADDDFVYDGTTYTVLALAQDRTNNTLELRLDKSLPTSGLLLVLGGVILSLSGATESTTSIGGATIYGYSRSGTNMAFAWDEDEAVAVSIEEVTRSVTVSSTELTLQEGSSADYTVVLDSEPTGDVTITIGGHANTDVSVSPGSLTFTSGNWETAQTVTVTAAADADAVADAPVTLTHTVTGAAEYAGIAVDPVTVTITETDTPGVTISPTELTLVEGESRPYTVVLDTQPTDDVTITIGGHANTDVSVSPGSLTFTSGNWETAQTVTVTAAADADAVTDPTVTLTHTGSGATEYTDVKGGEVDVTITETDTAGVAISKRALTLVEGESGDYTLELTSEPTATVTVTLGGHAGTDVSVSPDSLTFNAANWDTARTVTVTVDHDPDTADAAVTLSHAVSGTGEYAGVTAGSVTVNITDDDNPVSIAADAASVVEGNAATFTLTRTGYLAQARTVNVALTETGDWGYIQDPAPTARFAANANATTLTVNTNDDKVVGNSGSVTAALGPGASYVAVPPNSATVDMTDNDTAGEVAWDLMVSPDTITEGDAGTTVTLSITNGYTFAAAQTVDLYFAGFMLEGGPLIGEGETQAITIDPGDSSGSLVVIAVDDDFYNAAAGQYTRQLTAWRYGTQIGNAVDLTLVDDEPPPVVTLTALADEIVEGDTITLTVTASPPCVCSYSIAMAYTDSGGVVTGTVPNILRFPARQSELNLTITTYDDLVDAPDAEVPFTLWNAGHPATLGTPSSVTVRVRDDDVKPGAPQSFNAVAGDTVADLTWQTGDSGSEPITKYQYRVSGDGGDNWNPDWGDIPGSGAGTTSYQATGLRNDTGYLFQIRAVNIVGEGATARKGIGSYSTLVSAIINGREYLAPSDFQYQRDLEFDTGSRSYVVAAEYLEWRAPAWWWSAGDTCCPDPELSRYEIQRRTRATWSSWSDWEEIHDLDIYDLHNENRRENGAIARYWLVNYPENGAPFCRKYEWRVRAIYFEPARHSQWVVANHNRMPEARVPLRPKLNRQDQLFQETGENAYSLTFVWPTAQAPCYPDTQYQVQRRSFVGSWYGYNSPADGAALSNGAIYDKNTMIIEGNRVWTNWVKAGTFSGSTRQYTHTFNGRINYQLRVRAENANGWGPWSRPWLFSIDLSPNSQYWTDIY